MAIGAVCRRRAGYARSALARPCDAGACWRRRDGTGGLTVVERCLPAFVLVGAGRAASLWPSVTCTDFCRCRKTWGLRPAPRSGALPLRTPPKGVRPLESLIRTCSPAASRRRTRTTGAGAGKRWLEAEGSARLREGELASPREKGPERECVQALSLAIGRVREGVCPPGRQRRSLFLVSIRRTWCSRTACSTGSLPRR